MTTIAQQIAAQFDENGQCFYNKAGEHLLGVLHAHQCRFVGGVGDRRDCARWIFADGSSLITAGGGWDLPLCDDDRCFCWAGNGTHGSACPLSAEAGDKRLCCPFHEGGGHPSYSCGGDTPNNDGRHSPMCSYHAGGECTCGADPVEWEYDDGSAGEDGGAA